MAKLDVLLLDTVGKHIYGDRWKHALSADISLSDRQVSRWVHEGVPLPDTLPSGVTLRAMLISLLEKHQLATAKLLTRLEKSGG